jgi:hypothetical protein
MSLPSWQQGQAEEELEYQRTMKRLGDAEQQRMAENFLLDDDIISLDDGRPGIGVGWGGLTLGSDGRLVYYVIGLLAAVIIIVVGQALKHSSQVNQQKMQFRSGQMPPSSNAQP